MSKTIVKKPKPIRKGKAIFDAYEALGKALAMDDPDIVIQLHGGLYPEDTEILQAIKDFRIAYEKHFGRKASLELQI